MMTNLQMAIWRRLHPMAKCQAEEKCQAAVKEALQAAEMAAKGDLAETEGKAEQEPAQK